MPATLNAKPRRKPDTLADVLRDLGDIPPDRVLWDPYPGTATEKDHLRLVTAEPKRRVELFDGMLVEKPMGSRESYWAFALMGFLWSYQRTHNIGIFGAPDTSMRLAPGLIRLPDTHFTSWLNLPDDTAHLQPVVDYPPDLAVEIVSESDRPGMLTRKIADYFKAGTKLLWLIDPVRKTIDVMTSPKKRKTLGAGDTLDGGDLLPGFTLPLSELFGTPQLNPRPAQS